MDIPPFDELYCGQSESGCNECAPRGGRALTCYRQTPGQQTTGVCIAAEHCPRGDDCIEKCKVGIGCFGDNICDKNSHPPEPRECHDYCGSNAPPSSKVMQETHPPPQVSAPCGERKA